MKNIFRTIILFTFWGCNAQSPVVDLEAWRGQTPANFYLQDVYGVLNPFEGTWLYTNSGTTLKITLKKITLSFNGLYYEDLLIGEYQYIKDGEELFNTLSEIDNILTYQDHHNIAGNILKIQQLLFIILQQTILG